MRARSIFKVSAGIVLSASFAHGASANKRVRRSCTAWATVSRLSAVLGDFQGEPVDWQSRVYDQIQRGGTRNDRPRRLSLWKHLPQARLAA